MKGRPGGPQSSLAGGTLFLAHRWIFLLQVFPPIGTSVLLDQVPTLRTLFQLGHLLKDPISRYSTLGVRAPISIPGDTIGPQTHLKMARCLLSGHRKDFSMQGKPEFVILGQTNGRYFF